MSTATLGDFFDAAYGHFDEAATNLRAGLQDYPGATTELQRLTGVMGRYLDAVTGPNALTGDDVPPWNRTATDIRQAVHAAGQYLGHAAEAALPDLSRRYDPVVHHLALATDALAVGGDLLWSHVSLDQEGARVPRTDWARLLRSAPFTLAITDEVTTWARRALHVMEFLPGAHGQFDGLSRPSLRAAHEFLLGVTGTHQPTGSENYDMVDRRELLRSTTPSRPPRRIPPGVETDSDLCMGIENSARRLDSAAFTISQLPGDSPKLTRDAWRTSARTVAIVSDISHGTTAVLSDRAAALGIPRAAEAMLRDASEAFQHAATAWLQVTDLWRDIQTDTQLPLRSRFPDGSDLVLRMGRLLHAKPDWVPGAKVRSAARTPDSLAPGRPELLRVLAAVHESADAITRLGIADLKSVQAAYGANRLYVRNEAVHGPTARFLYVPIADHQAHLLMNAYQIGVRASLRAVTALDTVALSTGSASKFLSLAWAATGRDAPAPEPGYELDPEIFTRHRRPYFSRGKGQLRSSEQLDPDTVVREYKESGLSVRECAVRFTATVPAVTNVLAFSGLKDRYAQWKPDDTYEAPEPEPDAPETPEEPAKVNDDTSVTSALKEMGVTDPIIRQRGLAIDRAAAALINQASSSAPTASSRPAEGSRTAAGLAALDKPVPATRHRRDTPPPSPGLPKTGVSRTLPSARSRSAR